MTSDKTHLLLKELGFISHYDDTNKTWNWSCYLPEKSFIIRRNDDIYNVIKVKHKFAEDGSFCSSLTVGTHSFNEEELTAWLQKKKDKKCQI